MCRMQILNGFASDISYTPQDDATLPSVVNVVLLGDLEGMWYSAPFPDGEALMRLLGNTAGPQITLFPSFGYNVHEKKKSRNPVFCWSICFHSASFPVKNHNFQEVIDHVFGPCYVDILYLLLSNLGALGCFLFPRATVINCHQLSGLKQHIY